MKKRHKHIEKVLVRSSIYSIPNITSKPVMLLRSIPMSLTGAASRWLRNEPTSSITTWDGLKTKFLNKYCPPGRTAKKMEEINNFQQEPDENLYQAWERFKELLMKSPQHYLMEMHEVILFYNGLGIPTRQILDSRASVGVMPLSTYLNLGLGELAHTKLTVELADKTVKYPKRIAEKRTYLRERMELDLEARIMGETLVLNRSLDPFLEDYIELNDLNKPFEIRRNQSDDLIPTIEEGEVIEEFRTRDDELDAGIDDYSRPREENRRIFGGRIYKSGDLEVLES
ncbi:reverse transcriptase domain-containing protein [Tanacetum coccineum]